MVPEGLSKNERIKLKKEMGLLKDRHSRKLEKFSDNFNSIFLFFLNSYRKGLLNFGGIAVETYHKNNGYSARETFRRFDDGQYNNLQKIESRQNNILHGVITAKKSWGLFVNEWSKGIAEGSFMKKEIIDEFNNNGIEIPKNLLLDFENRIYSERLKYFKSNINK